MRLGAWSFGTGVGVLSVAKLTVGQEAYYEQQVAAGLDDYYAGRGESPGIWAGRGAELLEPGRRGRGRRSRHAAARRRPGERGRAYGRRCANGRSPCACSTSESGEWREEPKRLAPVSGYDLVFSCPKSVSLAARAHRRRARAARDQRGARGVLAGGARLSRARGLRCSPRPRRRDPRARRGVRGGGVPASHEPGAGPAPAHARDRRQPRPLRRRRVAGARRRGDPADLPARRRLPLRGATFATSSRERLGLDWTEPVKGMAELEGVPEEAVRAFSTRRQSLLEHMEALGTEGFAASRVAALATREAKEQVDLPRLREEWQARAAEHGLGRRELRALVGPPAAGAIDRARRQPRSSFSAATGLTAKQTTFTHARARPRRRRRASATAPRPTMCSTRRGARGASRVSSWSSPSETPGRPARFTTRELLEVEREALELALRRSRGRRAARASWSASRSHRTCGSSPSEQRMLVHERAQSRPRRLRRRRRRLRQDDGAPRPRRRLPRGRASPCSARRRAAAPPTSSPPRPASAARTLHRLLLDAQREGGLPRGCVLVVDEAGMAETRVLAPLLQLVDDAEGKAILVGDPQPASGRRRRRPLPRSLRPTRRDRPVREPPPARPDRARRARAASRTATPSPTSPTPRRRGRLHLEDDADRRPSSDCSRTGGRRPSATSPARSCSPTGAPTSATSTTPPAR